jgi:hypothetical protein
MGRALDIGRAVFLQALDLLTDTQATYNRESDQVKTLLTTTIFGKLYIDADPNGRANVTEADLADPFAAILHTTHNPTQHRDPGNPPTRHRPAQRPVRTVATLTQR